ncbi:MAG TPA: hypothetical protein VGF52_05430, partial [Tepidisphaeraceae bacterium]
ILIAVGNRRIAFASFVLLLLIHGGIGVWKIRTAPKPRMDVFVFYVDSAHALARGENPYAITFANVYAPLTTMYGPGLVKDDRVQFGFPYPPLVLMWTAPAQLLLGDFRYAFLAAMLASAVMILAMRPDKLGMLIAAILLFMPRTFYLLEIGFTEPLSAMLLAATILCALRWPKLMPVMLGLFWASKQYLPAAIFLLPILYMDRRLTRTLVVAIFFAAVVTLPLALWDFPAFWHSVVSLQFQQPYRGDSASFLAWWGIGKPGWIGPAWAAFVGIFIAIALCLWRCARTPAGFAGAMALCFFIFFAFSKQAFANYYYLVIAAMCVAMAAEDFRSAHQSADKKIIGPCEASSP